MKHFLRNFCLSAFFTAFLSFTLVAQTATKEEVPKGWHTLDKKANGFYGISLDQAYEFLKSKNKTAKPVIVAVIDSGIDTAHEDLRDILWINKKEIPGNGIDDDGNGYIDDVHGWNFLGGKDGRNVEQDSYEVARVYHKYKSKWAGKTPDLSKLSRADKEEFEMWKKAEAELTGNNKSSGFELIMLKRIYTAALKSDSILRKAMGKEKYTGQELEEFKSTDSEVKKARMSLLPLFQGNDAMESNNQDFLEGFGDYLNSEEKKANAADNPPKPYRAEIVQDNYEDLNDRFYGNSNLMVSNKSALHGTHVSGIIGAVRNNGLGMDGIADNVRIMTLRAVPDGDEHDKDIALAIRYAVDNGAQIINMSFGKSFSPEKRWVDEAVKYAESKDVLLVHAAGNDGKNLDETWNFPSPTFIEDGKRSKAWITVGASGDPKTGGLVASFSNYGKKEVDVFAPGTRIYSTTPGGNNYANLQGTSMASPVVAGLAALILSYYPDLSAQQLKMVIEKSAVAPDKLVPHPETGEEVSLNELCVTGGIVNAYEAVKLASTLKGERKKATDKKPF
jgi:subtilisin family serine protease